MLKVDWILVLRIFYNGREIQTWLLQLLPLLNLLLLFLLLLNLLLLNLLPLNLLPLNLLLLNLLPLSLPLLQFLLHPSLLSAIHPVLSLVVILAKPPRSPAERI